MADAYELIDPLGVLPVVLRDLTFADLRDADAVRTSTQDGPAAEDDDLIKTLREEHRHRPGLQRELDQAGLP